MCTVHWPCAEDKQTWQYMMNRTDEQKRLLTVMECATDNRPFCAKCMPSNLVKNPFTVYMFFTNMYDQLGNVYATAEMMLWY